MLKSILHLQNSFEITLKKKTYNKKRQLDIPPTTESPAYEYCRTPRSVAERGKTSNEKP